MPRQRYNADQFEFSFIPKFTADVSVERGEDGRVSMTVETSGVAWVSTTEAGMILGRSVPWIRERLESGWLRGRRIGHKWEVDAAHCEERKTQARNW
jgi:hypothetical protein